jgi:hypothetical protein
MEEMKETILCLLRGTGDNEVFMHSLVDYYYKRIEETE